jgi:hypothetical protein
MSNDTAGLRVFDPFPDFCQLPLLFGYIACDSIGR